MRVSRTTSVLVVPRVRPARGGEALPLLDYLAPILNAGTHGIVAITGPEGSGKTAALEYLAHALSPEQRRHVRLIDDAPAAADFAARNALVIMASQAPDCADDLLEHFEMVPWSPDDWIEYLLTNHRDQCASVMRRLENDPDRHAFGALPQLWRIVLDAMAQDPSIIEVAAALRWFLASHLSESERAELATHTLRDFTLKHQNSSHAWNPSGHFDPRILRLVNLHPVRAMLASQQLVEDLEIGHSCAYLADLPIRDILRETARLALHRPLSVQRLHAIIKSSNRALHRAAASLLLAIDPLWRPIEGRVPDLQLAWLPAAQWDGILLPRANLDGVNFSRARLHDARLPDASLVKADLSHATLTHACLDSARLSASNLSDAVLSFSSASETTFSSANLAGARFDHASLKGALFQDANLNRADFTGSNLRCARFRDADLTGADFAGANLSCAELRRADLSACTLDGARFCEADLRGCKLAGVSLRSGDFRKARLKRADLTASVMPAADFRKADLRRAYLADVEWEKADLRGADLRGATFHLGSTRSGLVATPANPHPPAGEGSRTGFYTDESEEQQFRPPEDIRKANLCGADLRGAKIKDVDFYLVDLRGAVYTRKQHKHLRRCRAILSEDAPFAR